MLERGGTAACQAVKLTNFGVAQMLEWSMTAPANATVGTAYRVLDGVFGSFMDQLLTPFFRHRADLMGCPPPPRSRSLVQR